MPNKKIIAGNWKMNTTIDEAVDLASKISNNHQATDNIEVVLCPPSVNLGSVVTVVSNEKIKIGGQNCHFMTSGAYTGEISPVMLKSIGCEYVILGHSERREIFGERNSIINSKIKAALNVDLKVIFCVGETLEQREAKKTFPILGEQIFMGLDGIEKNLISESIIIAYEPVWAIGTGKTATALQITEAHNRIRDFLIEIIGKNGIQIPILYGGSMKETNAKEILNCENVSGGLIGGASLKPESFLEIIDIAKSI